MWQFLHLAISYFSKIGFVFGIKSLNIFWDVGSIVANHQNKALHLAIEHAQPFVVSYLLSLQPINRAAFESDGGRALNELIGLYPACEIQAQFEQHYWVFSNKPIRKLERDNLTRRIGSASTFFEFIEILSSASSFFDKRFCERLLLSYDTAKDLYFYSQANDLELAAVGLTSEYGVRDTFLKFVREKYAMILPKHPYLESEPEIAIGEVNWVGAQRYFLTQSPSMKYDKKANNLSHSLIKVGECNYALQSGNLGRGATARVKMAIDASGHKYAVKIYQPADASVVAQTNAGWQSLREILAMQQLHCFNGMRTRRNSLNGLQKTYIITHYIPGRELHDYLFHGNRLCYRNLDLEVKYILALKAAKSLFAMHEQGVLHCDVKSENFKVHYSEQSGYCVDIYDYGFSQILGENSFIEDYPRGSMPFIAPELRVDENDKKVCYSVASDIYALGKMLQNDFQLPLTDDFYNKLLAEKPEHRMKWPEIFATLSGASKPAPSFSAHLR